MSIHQAKFVCASDPACSSPVFLKKITVENPEKNLLGVQWHPEEMYIRYPRFANLFRWLVEKAAACKK